MINEACYATDIAEDAIYTDYLTVDTSVRVVPVYDAAVFLGGAEYGVRGARKAFRILKSALGTTPRKGEQIVHDGTTYKVDDAPDEVSSSPQEWLIYVTT